MSRPPSILMALLAAGVLLALGNPKKRRRPLPGYAPKDYQTECDPDPKPGAIAFRKHMLERYGGADWGIERKCSIGGISEHKEGRAFDWHAPGSPDDMRAGWAAVAELLAPDAFGRPHAEARRWGIQYLVWDRHQWHAELAELGQGALPLELQAHGVSPLGWKPYTVVGTPTLEHRDHVHATLSREAAKGAPLA